MLTVNEAYREKEKFVQIYLQKRPAFLPFPPPPVPFCSIDPTFIPFIKPCNNLALFTPALGFVVGFIMNSGVETLYSL